jgi:hypothetical protein
MSLASMPNIAGAAAIASMGVVTTLQAAEPLTPKECRAEYRATVAFDTPGNATWELFRRAHCPSTTQIVSRAQAQVVKPDVGASHIAQCMQDWDAATHMTKQEWARTCRRVVRDRIEFRLDQTKR